MKKNGTFNSSKPEDDLYEMLCNIFGKEHIFRQFKSERYPFSCDFYIDSEDLFIECNYGWMHGGHFFDENSSEDQAKLNYWKNKNTEFYDNAIRNWTIRDKKKADIASKNALHMLVFWTQDEGKYWINSYADAHQMLGNSQYNIIER